MYDYIKIMVFVLLIIAIYMCATNIEYFNAETANEKINDELKQEFVYDGKRIMDDALFSDVVLYENDDDLDGDLGLEKCMRQCKGVCVEYGVSGDAYCFPHDDKAIKEKYKESLVKMSQPEEKMIGNQKN